MKIEITKEGNIPAEWIRFKITGVPVSFVNAIRRTIMTEVPCMAIEDVNILKNNSALYDEVLALRLGLIPIKSAPENYENTDNHKVAFILKGEGPTMLYSKDMQSMDPEIVPAFDNIPIVKLEKGQEVEIEAWAIADKGKEHVKWQPGHAFYKQLSEDSFEMYVESFGNMPVKALLIRAARAIKWKGEEFQNWVEKIK
ncbi:MAG: DNA-directed RNA polymerase subunit D [Candidatus Altiarchaeota archaeon]|nr:DNA-directed RNA polymerase subunit D [Candidatus Altiarchaeota archaeon]